MAMAAATTKKKKPPTFAAIAKSVLRMALVWAGKGGALKRANNKWLKGGSSRGHSDRMRYGERQLSFDETPAFRFGMHRPASMRLLSCVNPSADFDDCDDRDYFKWSREEEDDDDDDNDDKKIVEKEEFGNDVESEKNGYELVCKQEELVEQEIDTKAEEFITKFYAQMKMQRQISLLQYYEMLERSCG